MKYIASLVLVSLAIAIPGAIEKSKTSLFRVVIDPGHGGMARGKLSTHGDRFDALSGTHLAPFAEGARYRDYWEHILVYQIALKTKEYLDLCAPGGDYSRFRSILAKYTDFIPERIMIEATLSRGDSSDRNEIKGRPDPNSEFRLYDFPDSDGILQSGRISRINALKPHLVVSLHMTNETSALYRGMNPVIAAPHSILNDGLLYLQGKKKDRSFFLNSKYNAWFRNSNERSTFQWFLNGCSTYFTGFPLTRKGTTDHARFLGYRYNMITWAYRDDPGWEEKARLHPDNTAYAKSIMGFTPEGKFWDREKTPYESYRRDGGEEGYGGDNMFATSEIIRYILHSLYLEGEDHPHQRLTRPFISTWSIPLLVNAVTAFIELGSLSNERHRYIFLNKQEEIAEGIAVGIYSLLAGITPRDTSSPHVPKGKKLDLEKYSLPEGSTYFEAVTGNNR